MDQKLNNDTCYHLLLCIGTRGFQVSAKAQDKGVQFTIRWPHPKSGEKKSRNDGWIHLGNHKNTISILKFILEELKQGYTCFIYLPHTV